METKKVQLTEARNTLGRLCNLVSYTGEYVLITKGQLFTPKAVLVGADQFKELA